MNPDDRLTCEQLLESAYLNPAREEPEKRKGKARRRQVITPEPGIQSSHKENLCGI